MTNDRLNAPPSSSNTTTQPILVETRFVPRQYEPNYAYPLLVLFHARGGDEDQLVRAMPALSWRNYVGLGLQGAGCRSSSVITWPDSAGAAISSCMIAPG